MAEIDRLPVWRQRGIEGSRIEVGQLLAARSIGVHQANLIDLVDETGVHDFAIRRGIAELRCGRRDLVGRGSRLYRRKGRGREPKREQRRRGKLKKSCRRGTGGHRGQIANCQRRGCGSRVRWVLPDKEETAHQNTEHDQATAQSADQEFIKKRVELIRGFHQVNSFQRKIISQFRNKDSKQMLQVPIQTDRNDNPGNVS